MQSVKEFEERRSDRKKKHLQFQKPWQIQRTMKIGFEISIKNSQQI